MNLYMYKDLQYFMFDKYFMFDITRLILHLQYYM